jgi:hypothetical protein
MVTPGLPGSSYDPATAEKRQTNGDTVFHCGTNRKSRIFKRSPAVYVVIYSLVRAGAAPVRMDVHDGIPCNTLATRRSKSEILRDQVVGRIFL